MCVRVHNFASFGRLGRLSCVRVPTFGGFRRPPASAGTTVPLLASLRGRAALGAYALKSAATGPAKSGTNTTMAQRRIAGRACCARARGSVKHVHVCAQIAVRSGEYACTMRTREFESASPTCRTQPHGSRPTPTWQCARARFGHVIYLPCSAPSYPS